MKRFCVMLLAALTLSGCSARWNEPYRRQMDDLALLGVVGVDRAADEVELTAADEAGERLSARSATLTGVMSATRDQGEHYVFYGHVDRLLLGETLVERGLAPVLDGIARDRELGSDVRLWVVRGQASRVVMSVDGLSRRLEQLERSVDVPRAGDAMGVLAREGSFWLPALELVEQDGVSRVHPAGYAVVRKGLLVGYTDREGTQGLDLLTGAAEGAVTELNVPEVGAIGLRLERSRVDVCPRFEGERLVGLDVVCRLSARVAQTAVPLDGEDMEQIVYELEWQQGRCLACVLEQAQYWDADFAGLEYRARKGRPSRSAELSRQWAQVFRDLDIRVRMEATVEQPSA